MLGEPATDLGDERVIAGGTVHTENVEGGEGREDARVGGACV
jgi:hypothetical protein